MSNNNNEQKENSANDTKQVSKSEDKDFDEDYIYQNTEKIDDYIVLKELGRGSFGLVYLVQNEISKKKYALKAIDKELLSRTDRREEALIERYILSICKHPSIVKLSKAFQRRLKLYFVMEYCPNKDLDDLIKKFGTLDNDLALQIIAELVNVINYLHNDMEISHNDLKPSNILLDENYHIKLIDFSTSKVKGKIFDRKKGIFVESDESVNKEIFGTAEFLSPEMVNQKITDYRTNDIWSLGIIIYIIFNGESPFKAENDFFTCEKIKKCKFEYVKKDIPEDVIDLLNNILIEDTDKRFDIKQIKNHKYFKDINWDTLLTNKVPINLEKLEELDKINIENNENENFWEQFCDNINKKENEDGRDAFFEVEKLEEYPPKINKDFFYSKEKVDEYKKMYIVGVLKKKIGFIEKDIKFKLNKKDKNLLILDLDKNELIKNIHLDNNCKIIKENENEFILNGDKFRTSQKEVDKWYHYIAKLINFK